MFCHFYDLVGYLLFTDIQFCKNPSEQIKLRIRICSKLTMIYIAELIKLI